MPTYTTFPAGLLGFCWALGTDPRSQESQKLVLDTTHTKQYPNYCVMCNKGFTDKEYNRRFKLHIKKCTEKKVKEKACKECGTFFSRLSAFKRHIASHAKLKDFVCNICEKAYADKRNLKIHMDRRHNSPE